MVDLSKTIQANTDQLNADDLIGKGCLITTITRVSAGNSEQPIKIEHNQGLPWYPCKGMRRVLIQAWGADGSKYVGRTVELFRDADVKYGGIAVGGIRIKGLSHIQDDMVAAVTVARSAKKAIKIRKLELNTPPPLQPVETVREGLMELADEAAKGGLEAYAAFFKIDCNAKERSVLLPFHEGLKAEAQAVDSAKIAPTELEEVGND